MRKFLRFLLFIFLGIVLLAYILDVFYTYTYNHPIYARNKPSWLKKINNDIDFDYILLGSSRCIEHLNPVQIDKQTGERGINLGYAASGPLEIKLMLHEYLKNHPHPKKVFVQLDDKFNQEYADTLAVSSWIPFLKDDYIFEEITKNSSFSSYHRYIPFYRYCLFESKLGIRNIAMSYVKQNNFERLKGFVPIDRLAKSNYEMISYELKNKPNQHIEEIEKWCKEKNIEVYFFTAPYFKRTLNTDVIRNHVNSYSDFSQLFKDQRMYFGDPNHLNKEGAKVFTDYFIKEYF